LKRGGNSGLQGSLYGRDPVARKWFRPNPNLDRITHAEPAGFDLVDKVLPKLTRVGSSVLRVAARCAAADPPRPGGLVRGCDDAARAGPAARKTTARSGIFSRSPPHRARQPASTSLDGSGSSGPGRRPIPDPAVEVAQRPIADDEERVSVAKPTTSPGRARSGVTSRLKAGPAAPAAGLPSAFPSRSRTVPQSSLRPSLLHTRTDTMRGPDRTRAARGFPEAFGAQRQR